MNAKLQVKLSLVLLAAMILMAVGLSEVAVQEQKTVTLKLELPAPTERTTARPQELPGNVYEPTFRFVAPVAEPTGL